MTSAEPMENPSLPANVYDILGCGFGPANLAIAAALTDKWSDGEVSVIITQF